jgi:hypothetical protein
MDSGIMEEWNNSGVAKLKKIKKSFIITPILHHSNILNNTSPS